MTSTSDDTEEWLTAAAAAPLAFAQVREDSRQDLWVAGRLPNRARVLMVASGGCTAAALAAVATIERLHLVDLNPAQLALSRIKLRLLARPRRERMELLGHLPMPPLERQHQLRTTLAELDLPDSALGPAPWVAEVGPDHAGRYERLFARLRQSLAEQRPALMEVLRLGDPAEQARRVAPQTELGRALDAAYDEVLRIENLERLFGREATKNRIEPFSRHFARRTRHALASMPAATNPYLWQMLAGQFPPAVVSPWLEAAPGQASVEVVCTPSPIDAVLAAERAAYDYVHLSNILDWLDPNEAARILELTWRSLRDGGWVMIRQLNSSLDIKSMGGRLKWLSREAASLHASDRSFFYRELHLGQKR